MSTRALSSIILVAFVSACATTRYEEFGELPSEAGGEAGPGVEKVVVSDREMLEVQIEALKQRVGDLEVAIQPRLDQLDSSYRMLLGRISALTEQIQEMRSQVQGPQPDTSVASRPTPLRGPQRPVQDVNALYESAIRAFDRQAYGEAMGLFRQILKVNPKSPLADNAEYWIGECAYAVEDYRVALDAFKRVFQYKETEKDDDAQLKLGYSYLKLRDLESALIEFKRFTVDYPQSEYLARAEEEIRRIRAAKVSAP